MSRTVSETIAGEGSLLLISFLFGIGLMMLYDVFRIFRQLRKHGTVLTAAEDVFYWFCCAVGIFAMLYQENEGLLRWFVIGGVALGMLFENYLISPWTVRFFVKILGFFLGILRKILHIVGKPMKKTHGFFRKELQKMKKAIKIGLSKE